LDLLHVNTLGQGVTTERIWLGSPISVGIDFM
jgi:hypothetical protein